MAKFKKGKSGNPLGRPTGAADRRRVLREQILSEMPSLIAKVIALAQSGDAVALRLLIDRALPPLRAELPEQHLGRLDKDDVASGGRAILGAMARGEISPDAGRIFMETLSVQSRLVETSELERRITQLEDVNKERSK